MPTNLTVILQDEPLRVRLQRILRGLKQPKSSPEYEYARYALLSLYGPYVVSAVACALIVLLSLLFSFARDATAPVPDSAITVEYIPKPSLIIDPGPTPSPPPRNSSSEPSEELTGFSNPAMNTSFLAETAPPLNPASEPDEPNVEENEHLQSAIPVLTPMGTCNLKLMNGDSFHRTANGIAHSLGLPDLTINRHRPDGTGNTTEDAVLRSLRWLKKYQEADGSWNARSGGGPGYEESSEPALTGLALLTFLAHGETPNSKEFGSCVEAGIKWLVANQNGDGHFKKRDKHDYAQPIAAYALCEAFGMTQVPMVRDAARKSVDVIIKGQHACGGWNYNCDGSDRNDTSYSGWCAQALKAARMASLDNDGLDKAMKKAVEGFRSNFRNGIFAYESRETSSKGYLTPVGVLCLQILGSEKDADARAGMDWMNQHTTCDWAAPWSDAPIYEWYYTTQAKFHVGGEAWKQWNGQFSTQLVANQQIAHSGGIDGKDVGHWEGLDSVCKSLVYNTTLCTLMLEVYYRYLPTYKIQSVEAADTAAAGSDDIKVGVNTL